LNLFILMLSYYVLSLPVGYVFNVIAHAFAYFIEQIHFNS